MVKNIIEELNGERIDIVRWNDSLQVLIPNALQPAQIADVFTYPLCWVCLVWFVADQLSLAIGRRGQNVRLASKLVGMDIEIMTHDELGEALERAERWFGQLPHSTPEIAQSMIEEGFLSYNELTFIDAEELMQFTGLPLEQATEVIDYAEAYAEDMDKSAEEERAAAQEAAALEQQALQQQEDAAESSDGEPSVEEGANPESPIVSENEPSEPPAVEHHEPRHVQTSSMPTDARGFDEALIHEEERTGEDGELTTPSPEEAAEGPSA